nr:Unknown Function [uncultured bacterium]
MDAQRLEDHKKILGVLYVVAGLFSILIMLILQGVFTTIYAFAFGEMDNEEQATFQFVFSLVRYFQILAIAFYAVPTLIAGIGLLMKQSWAMILALIVAALKLFSFPVGTAIGIYAIWIYAEEQRVRKTMQPA